MKKTLSIAFTLLGFYAFSQNLVVSKRDYNQETYVYSLLTLNSNTGEILNSTDYITEFNSYSPKPLTFNHQTKEVIGLTDEYDKLVFKNIVTNDENFVNLSEPEIYYYHGVIVADNRLFVTTETTIQEINPSNGSIIAIHNLTNGFYYNRNLTYSSTTKDLYGLADNMIFKFNIITNQETTLVLPEEDIYNYEDIVIAGNRLFVNLRYPYRLMEINTENGSIINTYVFTTSLENYDHMRYMTFLADTQEICGIATGWSNDDYIAKIIKYNINTDVESLFDLPNIVGGMGDYGDIVSLITEESLSLPDFNQENEAKVIKVYNLLGQEVPVETNNQIVILKYDNGETKKVYNIQK